MRKDGLTLTEIKTKTGLSKTTIFHHIKEIPKTDNLKTKLRKIYQVLQKNVTDSRRGKSLKNHTFKKIKKWDPSFVNLVAHFLFDGRITSRSCLYYSRSIVLRELVISQMIEKLGVKDYKIYESFNDVKRVAYHNVELSQFIKTKSVELLGHISDATQSEKVAFLRAFFDDEGSVNFRNRSRIVRGYQHSLGILKIVHKLLKDFDIESKIYERFFEIVISKKDNLIRFQKLINFTPEVRINGIRSNSIWKKSLQKRDILNKAIVSYQL